MIPETPAPIYPSLFQINTRVRLTDLSRRLGRPVTLDDIPDIELDRMAGMGFDWVWLLSVWRTGPAGRQVSLTQQEWRREFRETLPDLAEHFRAGLDYQNKLPRFLENHDEPRAAATFAQEAQEAAAVITFLSPGLRPWQYHVFELRGQRAALRAGQRSDGVTVGPAAHE